MTIKAIRITFLGFKLIEKDFDHMSWDFLVLFGFLNLILAL